MLSEFKSDQPAAAANTPRRKDIRRLAMQVLYQLDMRGEEDFGLVAESVADDSDTADGKAFDPPELRPPAFKLASAAYESRAAADAVATELAPDWPSNRQPPVDRAIIRLAYHEMIADHAPAKIVVFESVELAKEYGTQQSPAFINGVLDKMLKKLGKQAGATPPGIETEADSQSVLSPTTDPEPDIKPGSDKEDGPV